MPPATLQAASGVAALSAVVDSDLCIGCGRCASVCPTQAIAIGPDGKATLDRSLCRGCAACVSVCPVGAVRMAKPVEVAS